MPVESNTGNRKNECILSHLDTSRVGVSFWPLLIGHIKIESLSIHGMQLNLIKNRQGLVNWQMKIQAAKEQVAHAKASAKQIHANTIPGYVQNLQIQSLSVKEGQVQYTDLQKDQSVTIKGVHLNLRQFNTGHSFPMNVAFTLESNHLVKPIKVVFNSDMMVDLQTQQFDFQI